MPEICRFYGIVIAMFFDEHNPPHFHAKYGKDRAAFDVQTLTVLEGWLPPRVRGLVVEWASQHQAELLVNWDAARNNGRLRKIDPLT